jgi:hypothetical protein
MEDRDYIATHEKEYQWRTLMHRKVLKYEYCMLLFFEEWVELINSGLVWGCPTDTIAKKQLFKTARREYDGQAEYPWA